MLRLLDCSGSLFHLCQCFKQKKVGNRREGNGKEEKTVEIVGKKSHVHHCSKTNCKSCFLITLRIVNIHDLVVLNGYFVTKHAINLIPDALLIKQM